MFRLKNLFPEDTRMVEIAASLSMFFSTLPVLIQQPQTESSIFFWLVVFALTAIVQLGSLLLCDKLEKIRVIASLVMGGLLTYVGIVHIGDTSAINYVTELVLGVGNLYAFLVNNQRLTWK